MQTVLIKFCVLVNQINHELKQYLVTVKEIGATTFAMPPLRELDR